MKNKQIIFISLIILLVILVWSCKKEFFRTDFEEFSVKGFISNIKSYNVNSEYDENLMPTDTTSVDKPYVSVQSWVIKGKDILMSITVPDDAEELYFGAINSQAEYMGLNFLGQIQNTTKGYYRLKLSNIMYPDTASNGLRNYQVVLSSNEKIQLSKFDLIVSCKTTKGISNKTSVPIDIISIAPYQKNLKVGFRPLTGYTYSIQVTTPSGGQIIYSYNKNTGTETFNNSQVPNSTLSYDSGLNFKWIDFTDPQFGGYKMTANIQIDLSGGSQYIYLYLAIITEGKIDQASLDVDIQQTGQNTAVGTANVGFSYFDDLSVKVSMIAFRQITPHFISTPVPDDQKVDPGVGIRLNGNDSINNLIKVMLHVYPKIPPDGVKYYLSRDNQNIDVWGSHGWSYPVLLITNQVEISFSGQTTKEIYIENTSFGQSVLEFYAEKSGVKISSDKIVFHSFNSIVFTIGGFLATPPDSRQGVWNLADDLYSTYGYDVYKYAWDGTSEMNSKIDEAINQNNVTNLAIIGYSYGGGSTYAIAKNTFINNKSITIPFTAYIDAVVWGSPNIPEIYIPCLSKLHLNYYQQNSFLKGDKWNRIECGYINPSVIEFNVSDWMPNMDHDKIHSNPNVLGGIKMYFRAWVPR